MDLLTFRSRFPEFTAAPDLLVESCLAEAGERAGGGEVKVGYLAAHLLAISPGGRKLRAAPEGKSSENDRNTSYYHEYLELCQIDGIGPLCP